MPAPVRLLVGLGNPGRQYDRTRHNAGARFVSAAAAAAEVPMRADTRFQGRIAAARIGTRSVHLFVPDAFMNVSGLPVARLARFFKIAAREVLVAHDDLELSPGAWRHKFGGGHGGHNGLRDVIRHLGSAEFARLRIGIGHPGRPDAVAAYVLQEPPAPQARLIDDALAAALVELPALVEGGAVT